MLRLLAFLSVLAIYYAGNTLLTASAEAAPSTGSQQLSDKEIAALLTGRWTGIYTYNDGEIYEFLINRKADGSYLIEYRSILDGVIIDEAVETGTWGVEGGEYTSQPTAVKVGNEFLEFRSPGNYRYEILFIDGTNFRYREKRLDMEFEARRVDDNFQLTPLPYAESYPDTNLEMAPTTDHNNSQQSINELSEEAHTYIIETGAEFVARYHEICIDTGARADAVATRADNLGWKRVNEGRRKNITSWASFDIHDAAEMQRLPFILELTEGGANYDNKSSCMLTMWGSSPAPEIATVEVELLIAFLKEKLSVGELSVSDKNYYEGRIVEYRATLRDSAHPNLEAAYFWRGGAHWLTAISSD